MFWAPFVMLGAIYHGLPAELPVLRLIIGPTVRSASKSPFIVFRVPSMNLIHGLIGGVMLAHRSDFENATRRTSYSNLFLTLLFTIALKSNLEAIDFFASTVPTIFPYAHWIALATLTCVLLGVALALIRGRKVKLPWHELRLSLRDKVALCGMCAIYVAIVIGSITIAH